MLFPVTPGPPPLQPLLVARYPARKAIKDKDWPKYIERALRAVADNEKLKKYDVLPPLLRDQYDVIGWLQVSAQHQQGQPLKLWPLLLLASLSRAVLARPADRPSQERQ